MATIPARMVLGGVDLVETGVVLVSDEVTEGSFDSLRVGDEIRLVQVTDAKITAFAPLTDGRPGRVCYGIVRGGPFNGTEQWQWVPSNDVEAEAMQMRVFIRTPPPPIGSKWFRPADGSTWAATDQPGLYACIGSGSQFQVGSTAWKQNLGAMEATE